MNSEIFFNIESFPLRIYWKRGAFAFLMIFLTVLLTFLFSKNIMWAGLAFLVVTAPSLNFLFPSSFIFYEDRFEKKQLLSTISFNYKDINEVRIGKDGVLIERKRRKQFDIIFIFDEKLKNDLFNFLENKYDKKE
jgi:hypothetical protein